MRSSLFSSFFLLFVALYFLSEVLPVFGHSGSSASYVPATLVVEEVQPQRDVKSSSSMHRKFGHQFRSEVLVERADGLNNVPVNTWKPEFPSTSHVESLDGFVYHTDYHGVTTHPTPTPKHPKP